MEAETTKLIRVPEDVWAQARSALALAAAILDGPVGARHTESTREIMAASEAAQKVSNG